MKLRGWFVRNRLGGNEIGVKTAGVRIEQLLDAFVALRLQNEANVVIFRYAIGNFRICVGGSIRMFLARERQDDSRVIASGRRKLVRLLPCPDFEARPLAPKVDLGCGLDDIRDIGAADASGDLDEIKLAVRVRAQELRMSHSPHEAEPFQ